MAVFPAVASLESTRAGLQPAFGAQGERLFAGVGEQLRRVVEAGQPARLEERFLFRRVHVLAGPTVAGQTHEVVAFSTGDTLALTVELDFLLAQVSGDGQFPVARFLAHLAQRSLLIGFASLKLALGKAYLMDQFAVALHVAFDHQDAPMVVEHHAAGCVVVGDIFLAHDPQF